MGCAEQYKSNTKQEIIAVFVNMYTIVLDDYFDEKEGTKKEVIDYS